VREKKSIDQGQEAGEPFQDSTQDIDMHISTQQNDKPLTGAPSFSRQNGLSDFVVRNEYNNTLPESDDRNFNFNHYCLTIQPREEVEKVAPDQASDHTPEDMLSNCEKHYIESVKERALDPVSYQDSSHLQERAEKRAMRKLQEFEKQSKLQAINQAMRTSKTKEQAINESVESLQARLQEEIMWDILHDQNQLNAFLQDFTPSQQEIARKMWLEEQNKVDEKYHKSCNSIVAVNKGTANSQPQANSRIPRHIGEDEEDDEDGEDDEEDQPLHEDTPYLAATYAKRLSKLLGRKRRDEFTTNMLHDQDRMNIYVQDSPLEHRQMAQQIWYSEQIKADDRLRKLLDQIGVLGLEGEGNYDYNDEKQRKRQGYKHLIFDITSNANIYY
jgi:hypothetical protein